MPGKGDLHVIHKAAYCYALQEIAVTRLYVVVDGEGTAAVIFRPLKVVVINAIAALCSENIDIPVAVKVINRSHIIHRRADAMTRPIPVDRTGILIPIGSRNDVDMAVAVDVAAIHKDSPPALVVIDDVTLPLIQFWGTCNGVLLIEPNIQARGLPIIWFAQDIQVAVAVQIRYFRLMVAEA